MHSEALSSLCSHWHRLASARTPDALVRMPGKVDPEILAVVDNVEQEEPLLPRLQLLPSQHLEKQMASPFLGQWLARPRCGYLLAVAASAL